ncbi:unnamed protein product [Clonostachys chloroleuca]|uniref:Ubiquitination network signaling protein acrB n=1 Tax=Clonostachys chloroleuca TaxID=1926264 RepID=A0AA35PXH5_9HYPO|nr:unnamed protein product [Clonostachys chloroleuca]
MPRGVGSSKRTSGAGQRDTRHENGLVGPATAKRAVGNKNSGQYEGAARSGAENVPGQAGLPSPNAQYNGSAYQHQLNGNGNTKGSRNGNANGDANSMGNQLSTRRTSLGTSSDETSSESGGSNMGNHSGGAMDGLHRQIDVNATKNVDVHRDSGPLELVTTVLKTLPIHDTLAILIILMHVPSVSLTFIYAIFTFLTFVPPVTTSSGMNINFAEIFDGNSTTPSPVTVMCMDLFFLLFWLFLWQPLQDILLDFAKPIIAITLGGGSGVRDGSSRGLTTCFIWVVFHHVLRGTRLHWTRFVRHIPENWPIPSTLQDTFNFPTESYDMRSGVGWVKSVLAVHILTQGIVRYVKEWYLRREKAGAQANMSDPEAGKSAGGSNDLSTDAGFSTTDAEAGIQHAPPPPPTTMSKKRRKQSTQIRLQQPLWAALASTKIVVMKEYELSHATSEQAGSNATDVHNLGNAPFEKEPCHIWISYVGSDEVCFNTSHFEDDDEDDEQKSCQGENGEYISSQAKHPQRPLYVRVNNAFWQPTRMFPLEKQSEDQVGTQWTGDIYGLRPASKYVCEFVDRRTDEVLFKTTIRTVHEPQKETDSGAPSAANGQPSLRPDSPATTLKTSIQAAESRLSDERNRLKASRKEWKSRTNALKKEIELTDHQLATAGNSDEKFRQKVRQQETQKSQAERDTEAVAEQLKNFDTAPELSDRRKKLDRQYGSEKSMYDVAKKEYEEFKSKLEKEVKSTGLEKSNLVSKVNKIKTRINRVETELNNISDANARGLDEVQRRHQERLHWEENTNAIEANYQERLNHIQASNVIKVEQIRALEAQLATFLDPHGAMALDPNGAMALDPNGGMGVDLDTYDEHYQQQHLQPWNPNPAAAPHVPNMWMSSSELMPSLSATSGVTSGWQPAMAPAFEPSKGFKSRGRSSSMLSDISGFTQSTNEEDSPPGHSLSYGWNANTFTPVRNTGYGRHDENNSGGSGNGSVSASPSP